jgi:hypothetical protein
MKLILFTLTSLLCAVAWGQSITTLIMMDKQWAELAPKLNAYRAVADSHQYDRFEFAQKTVEDSWKALEKRLHNPQECPVGSDRKISKNVFPVDAFLLKESAEIFEQAYEAIVENEEEIKSDEMKKRNALLNRLNTFLVYWVAIGATVTKIEAVCSGSWYWGVNSWIVSFTKNEKKYRYSIDIGGGE